MTVGNLQKWSMPSVKLETTDLFVLSVCFAFNYCFHWINTFFYLKTKNLMSAKPMLSFFSIPFITEQIPFPVETHLGCEP